MPRTLIKIKSFYQVFTVLHTKRKIGRGSVATPLPGLPSCHRQKAEMSRAQEASRRQAVYSVSAVHSGQDISPNPSKTRLYLRNAMATINTFLLLYPTWIKMKFYQFDANTSSYSL